MPRFARNGMPEYADATVFIKPKKNAANRMRLGLHWPKMSTASAKKP